MAIEFCKNTKFIFGTFMKIQSLIFSLTLDLLLLTRLKHQKKCNYFLFNQVAYRQLQVPSNIP